MFQIWQDYNLLNGTGWLCQKLGDRFFTIHLPEHQRDHTVNNDVFLRLQEDHYINELIVELVERTGHVPHQSLLPLNWRLDYFLTHTKHNISGLELLNDKYITAFKAAMQAVNSRSKKVTDGIVSVVDCIKINSSTKLTSFYCCRQL